MALSLVPLRPLPAQALSLMLGEQAITLRVFTRNCAGFSRLYCDAYLGAIATVNEPRSDLRGLRAAPDPENVLWRGRICRHALGLKRSEFIPLKGDFFFFDQRGTDDPEWEGLGSRWLLLWGLDEDWGPLLDSNPIPVARDALEVIR